MEFRILVINPGSTSTKVAVYKENEELIRDTITYSSDILSRFNKILDQYPIRKKDILDFLRKNGIKPDQLHAIVGRGGLLKPIQGGTYRVNQAMLSDLKAAERGEHASNLGAVLAYRIAEPYQIPAYIVDPVVVDEFDPVARLSGLKEIERLSIFHALNQRAVALQACTDLNLTYQESSLIVVHMGGGISIGCHQNGRVIDVNNAFDGEGPFSPERAGSVPAGQLVEMCFSGKWTQDEMKRKLVGCGGVVGYLNTNDLKKMKETKNSGNSDAQRVYEAMIYQIKKYIAAMAAVVDGKVDVIAFTGGMAQDTELVATLKKTIEWIAPVVVYPGEREMLALAQGVLRVMYGEEAIRTYC